MILSLCRYDEAELDFPSFIIINEIHMPRL